MTVYYPNFQLSNLNPTLPTPFKPLILDLLLSNLIVTPPRGSDNREILLYLMPQATVIMACPPPFSQWSEATVLNAIKWLLRQCGRPQTECRHACMELVCKLMPCFEGVSTPKQMFDSLLKENKNTYFITR